MSDRFKPPAAIQDELTRASAPEGALYFTTRPLNDAEVDLTLTLAFEGRLFEACYRLPADAEPEAVASAWECLRPGLLETINQLRAAKA